MSASSSPALSTLFTPPPPGSYTQVLTALDPPDGPSLTVLTDAMRCHLLATYHDRAPQPGHKAIGSVWLDTPIPGDRTFDNSPHGLTFEDTRRIITSALGAVGLDNLPHLLYDLVESRDHLHALLTDTFVHDCAVLLSCGWTQDDGFLWWTAGADDLPLDLASCWAACWGLNSLNACILAGFTCTELGAVLTSGRLPDPEAITTLAVMRHPTGFPPFRDGHMLWPQH